MPRGPQLEALAVFHEPQRRRVFDQLQHDGPCTVADLVAALGIGRTLVSFHLGKLVDAGFVEALAPDRSGGGQGRPAQRYRTTGREVVASVPERRYDLLAEVLLEAIAQNRPGESAHAAAVRAARRRGAELAGVGRRRDPAGTVRRTTAASRATAAGFRRLEQLLSALGYAPRRDGQQVTVRNCPFDRFRASHGGQVCSLNLALSNGYLAGLGIEGIVQAQLRPGPDTCCVVFSRPAA